MLLVKTSVRTTDLVPGQYGVFNNEFIPKGKIIWDYQGVVTVRPDTFKFLQEHGLTEYTEKYGTVDNAGTWTVDSDNTRYMNHSDKPNILFIDNIGVTLRDIHPNEELLCDYSKVTCKWHYEQLLGIKS